MNIKDKFIESLIQELNRENEYRIAYDKNPINVCYMVAALSQHLESCSEEFIQDISQYSFYINGYEEDQTEGYSLGSIDVLIEKPNEEKESEYMMHAYYDHHYKIDFLFDDRYWGYCECSPEDAGYVEEHQCIGMGCDWSAPAFRISKISHVGYGKWDGNEKDYWSFEKQFRENEANKNEEVERYQKEQEKKRLETQIKEIQERLHSL